MITTIADRVNSGDMCPAVTTTRSVEDAFQYLVEFELGFGGKVTKLLPHEIHVRTTVLNCVDTTQFLGGEQEMAPLVEVASLISYVQKMRGDKIMKDAAETFELLQRKGVSPLVLNLGKDIFLGKASIKEMVRFFIEARLGVPAEKVKNLSVRDCAAVVGLMSEGVSKEEILCVL